MVEIKIKGCSDCPARNVLDMAPGYQCALAKNDNTGNRQYIKQNKFGLPITPKWCPLKTESVLLKLENNKK